LKKETEDAATAIYQKHIRKVIDLTSSLKEKHSNIV